MNIDPESSPFIERKLGKFAVPMDWMQGMTNKHFQAIFQHFRIIRAEFDWTSQSIQYVAASEYFDEVGEKSEPGSYSIRVEAPAKAGESVSLRVVRMS